MKPTLHIVPSQVSPQSLLDDLRTAYTLQLAELLNQLDCTLSTMDDCAVFEPVANPGVSEELRRLRPLIAQARDRIQAIGER